MPRQSSLTLKGQVVLSDLSTTQSLIWSSDNPTVADVNAQGVVTSLQPGTVSITATSSVDPTKFQTLTLTVSNHAPVRFGGKIVYVADNDIYLMKDSNASPIRLTSDGATVTKLNPRLSWDGSKVVYATSDNKLFIVNSNGLSAPAEQVLPPNSTAPHPFFINSGELTFQAQGGPFGATYQTWVKVMPAGPVIPAITAVPTATALPLLGQLDAVGGLDYNGLVFYEQGQRIKRVLFSNPASITDLGPGRRPKIPLNIFSDHFVYDDAGKIMRMSFTGQVQTLTPGTDFIDLQPAIAPTQEKVVFVSNRAGNQDLFVMNADGSNVVNLTNTPAIDESMPDWSL